jgi:hypothetical protein
MDEGIRRQMEAHAARMKEAQGQFLAAFPKSLAKMQKELIEGQQRVQGMRDQVDQAKQQAAAAEAARKAASATPAKPVEGAIDRDLGQELRIELLQRFGNLPPSQVTPVSDTSDHDIMEILKKNGLWK